MSEQEWFIQVLLGFDDNKDLFILKKEHMKSIRERDWETSNTMVEDLLEGDGRIWKVYQIVYQGLANSKVIET
ncbi:hypothetical protein MTR_6g073060 [Medicago truncatula]|uniref:Uncharacterized protein n=1 Tax=Medicago truncatula TaxID=3880 RepID=A0A072UCK5_MEDTR|nr:hypothetical protein MTR_6g073060 [Medicago truncatula]